MPMDVSIFSVDFGAEEVLILPPRFQQTRAIPMLILWAFPEDTLLDPEIIAPLLGVLMPFNKGSAAPRILLADQVRLNKLF